jgi:hypothetical protein
MLKTLIAAAALAASTAAVAGPTHLSDAEYLTAVRCQALMASPELGKADTGAIGALIKSQGVGRIGAVTDRAEETRSDAARQARHAGVGEKAQLMAERSGVCETYASGGAPVVSPTVTQSGAN